jgi:hypothetical protein
MASTVVSCVADYPVDKLQKKLEKKNYIRTVNHTQFRGESRYKLPQSETTHRAEVQIVYFQRSGHYRLVAPPIPLIHPTDQKFGIDFTIEGSLYFDLNSIIDGATLVIPIVKNMWQCNKWTERFLYGWTFNITRDGDYITSVELHRHI